MRLNLPYSGLLYFAKRLIDDLYLILRYYQNQLNYGFSTQTAARRLSAIKNFYKSFKEQWSKENKSFGFEVSDIRLGGLILRLSHLIEIITDYINGKIDKIEALS